MATHVRFTSKDVNKLIQPYPNLSYNTVKNKVVCGLTGHEMPCKEDAIASYIKGKKYQKAKARDSSNYDKYKPHITASTKKYHEHQLFCLLTLRHINKTPEHVERHVNGARYKRAVHRWKECEKKGIKFTPYKRKRDNDDAPDNAKQDSESGADNSESDGPDEDDSSEADSCDDLYPAEDFKDTEETEDKDSDYDFDSAEPATDKLGTKPSISNTEKLGTKRKSVMKKQKQFKKKQKVG